VESARGHLPSGGSLSMMRTSPVEWRRGRAALAG
jgi:hypothetical protein